MASKTIRWESEIPSTAKLYLGIFAVSIGLALTIYFSLQDDAVLPILSPIHSNTYQMVTGDGSEEDWSRWDAVHTSQNFIYGTDPAPFLTQHIQKIPVGRALDIAMSEGRHAIYLAKKGFQVEGVDISQVALRKARRWAKEANVSVQTVLADLNQYTIKPNSYDLILNIQYLQRSLISGIKRGLKKGGYVVFENYTVDQLTNKAAQAFPREWFLERGELRELFKDGFEIIEYSETNDGKEAVASLIAKKL